MNEYCSSGLCRSALVGYRSMHRLENDLRSLNPHSSYLQGVEGQGEESKRTLPFFYRKVLDCVRYLLRQIAYQDDLSTPRGVNSILMVKGFMPKFTPRTGGGMFKYSALTAFTVTVAD